jgi:hypothetical protein
MIKMNKMLLTAVTIIAISTSLTAHADMMSDQSLPPQANRFVDNSYLVTFREPIGTENPLILPPNRASNLSKGQAPFGEHSTGQSKRELENTLGINGQVVRIFETINAAQIHMDSEEAYRLSLDERVELVEQEGITFSMATQTNPGWGLDRLDEITAILDNSYSYINNGAGQTIYILDTGLNVGTSSVTAEFGGRATIFYDFNTGGTGSDCQGHGTQVASAAAGKTYGVAKGATLKIVKVTSGCDGGAGAGNEAAAFNWLAANAPAGTIVNYSRGYSAPYKLVNGVPIFTCGKYFDTALENSIKAAHNAGIIVVVAAGNDGCNTANYSPANIPEAFVVGATQNNLLNGSDALAQYSGNGGSRIGWNISAFAPGKSVKLLNSNGASVITSGTSFSAPYIAGIFAVACQAAGTYCSTAGSAAAKYTVLRDTGILNTVTNTNGTPLTGATSRSISQQW